MGCTEITSKTQLRQIKAQKVEERSFQFYPSQERKLLKEISLLDAKESESGLSLEEINCRHSKKGDLQDIVFKEEIYWGQKSRILWLKEGDKFTSFYHTFANGRKPEI